MEDARRNCTDTRRDARVQAQLSVSRSSSAVRGAMRSFTDEDQDLLFDF